MNESLISAQEKIKNSCSSYCSGEIGKDEVCKILADIPEALWRDKASSLSMIKILMEDDDLIELSCETETLFVELVCGFIPEIFWDNKDSILALTEMLINFIGINFDFASGCDIDAIFAHFSDSMWQDSGFTTAMTEIISKRQNVIEGFGGIDEFIPAVAFENKDNAWDITVSIMESCDRNAVEFDLFPKSAWEDSRIVFAILDNLQEKLEVDRYHFTMYPSFCGSNRDYLKNMFDYISDDFKKDKDFAIEFLEYYYFFDCFDILFNWVDESLWSDKEFVMEALENDPDVLGRVSEDLLSDKEFRKYIEENFDMEDN